MFKSGIIFWLLLSVMAVTLCSCKKDVDSTAPVIEIFTPNDNQTFNVNDVVAVSGNVNDESDIFSVSVALINEQQQLVHTSLSIPVTSSNMSFNTHYALDNIHLESGIYHIMVTASDGKNESRKYKKIYLIAIPKVLQKVVLISGNSSSQTNWSYVDTNFTTITPLTVFSGNYTGSFVSSYYQMGYNCSGFSANFTAYNLKSNSIKYTVSGFQSINPYYTGVMNYKNDVCVARYDGLIKGYDNVGNPVYSAAAIAGYYPIKMLFVGDRLVAEQKNIVSQSTILVSYYATGSADAQINLQQEVIELIEKDNSNVFVFGNNSGQAVIQLYSITNNNLWNPYPFSLSPGLLLSAVKIDSDTYLLGHSNGTIYKYQYQTSSVTTFLTSYTAKKMIYDTASNRLYVAENNQISVFDYSSKALLKQISTIDNVLNIHLLFNR